ncbi:lipopolysaccharide core biosynthesis protein [archaeon BMS3Abin17]|nr:lipopolysaccharide core biosynthesis protein [archaeon BMS3Abin17]
MAKWNTECRFFNDKYACDTLSSENYKTCEECRFSQKFSKKILIIKLGAMGDVLRTTPILTAIKKKYGEEALIYWMTSPESAEILQDNPLIDKVLQYNPENILRIQQEKFDMLFSLEIDTPSTLLANLVNAGEKLGYFFDNGATSCFNKGSEAYLETAFLNHVKLKNKRTYQDLIFEACELDYNKEKLIFNLQGSDIKFANEFKEKNNILDSDRIIGINIGSADRWASKFWDIEKIKELIKKMPVNYKIIILAGPNEIEKQRKLIEDLKTEGISLISNNPNNSFREFAAVVDLCDKVICGDTMILHLATVLNKTSIALFFSTSPWEIEDYQLVDKIVSPLLEDYFYINSYIPELAESISVEQVLSLLKDVGSKITTNKNTPT